MANFEYVFLFRTKLFTQEEKSIEEPESLGTSSFQENGIPIDNDKRLFLRFSPQNSIDWRQNLKSGWLEICQRYTEHFNSEEKAKSYCQQALFGAG